VRLHASLSAVHLGPAGHHGLTVSVLATRAAGLYGLFLSSGFQLALLSSSIWLTL